MSCHCTECGGTGVIRERTERDTYMASCCWRCHGSGGWDEIDVKAGSPLAAAFIETRENDRIKK